ncbi:MAG: serine hydrolase [Bacteroidales bacterium]|nr:serine hydrolase [Bacteroidales bacterium]
MRLRILLSLIYVLFSYYPVEAQKTDPPFIKYMDHPWVDSVMNTLSTDKKIAQCIWIAGWSNRDLVHTMEVTDAIRKYGIGGIIFFQGTVEKQVELINFYQGISEVPLLIAMDAEWGIGMRLDKIEKFPYQLTLGAVSNDSLIYKFGKRVAEQCRRSGIDINLAPVADINNNPANPVINYRSFGEDRDNVASKALAYMRGLQENGVMATIKHFPGHGDTDIDSHSDLPVLKHTVERLDSVELYPFRQLINEGAGMTMTAHLNLPALDSTSNLPSSLSHPIVNDLLRDSLGFRGLIISDAMNMKAVTKHFKPGKAEALAFKAGNDVLEYVSDIEAALSELNKELKLKEITEDDINIRCRRVLALKYWINQGKYVPVDTGNIEREINSEGTRALIRELYANALTLLKNEQNILPLKNLDQLKIATVAINKNKSTLFQKRISGYKNADDYFIDPSKSEDISDLMKKLDAYDLIITGVYGSNQRPDRNYGITKELTALLDELISNNKTIISWFGNPYAIGKIGSLQEADGLLLTYQENEYTEDLAAQLIFGGIGAKGSLPVTINEIWPYDHGLITPGNIRIQYGLPESAGMSSEKLNRKIDSIVNVGLINRAFPGCEVMAARKGIVIFRKTYGFQTYDSLFPVNENDLFDLASVTKITATLPGLMLLDTEGKFSPDETLGTYLPFFRRSDKADLKMTEIMAHQSGLQAWIPYWKKTVKKNGKYKKRIYSSELSEKYPLEVANNLFISGKYRKKIFTEIRKSPLGEKKYLYSDLGFILSPDIIENLSGQRWYDYVTTNIYRKIGAADIGFNPYLKYPINRIVPTEYDSLFRKQLLHGTVHDEGAAMLGGISGHAGLFSTANDLMKLVEMYRRMGSYGGEQIIAKEVLERYTQVQFPENENRRGLGFDKPVLNNSEVPPKDSNTAKSASPSSFGHTGYTGTYIWIDPEYELSFIFLSNRVHPSRENNLISALNIRSGVLQALYDSIIE